MNNKRITNYVLPGPGQKRRPPGWNTENQAGKLQLSRREVWLLSVSWTAVLLFFLFVGLYLLFLAPPAGPVGAATAEPVDPTLTPRQELLSPLEAPPLVFERGAGQWTLTPRATYQIAARVLGTKRYSYDWQAAVSPLDLALAWGELSQPEADQGIRWRQSGRWYYYSWNEAEAYDVAYVGAHSANIHIIPATDNLEAAVKRVKRGEIILMEGWLVDVNLVRDGRQFSLKTSLTRLDSGPGACEILYVQRLVVNGQEYR